MERAMLNFAVAYIREGQGGLHLTYHYGMKRSGTFPKVALCTECRY